MRTVRSMRHIALRSAYHAPWLGTTHPMSPATSRPGAVSCCRCRLCYLGLPMSTEDLLHHLLRYSYASTLLPVAVFSALRFSWIPAAQALCADIDNSSSEVWCFTRASEALRQLVRNDAALASVPSCRSTLFCRQSISPSTYCRAAVPGTRRRVSSACFLRSGSLSMAFREDMIATRVE